MQIYVAHHQPGPHATEGGGYRAVCNVAADGSRPPGFLHYDDNGGFPYQNQNYCELSVLRKLQNDRPAEYVGLVHYRRLFSTDSRLGFKESVPGLRTIPYFDWANPTSAGAGVPELEILARRADWTISDEIDVCGGRYDNLQTQFEANHGMNLLAKADDAIREFYPNSISFRSYLQMRTSLRAFNMFLGRLEVLDVYASALWKVLDTVGDGESAQTYGARWAGFLAERIQSYWGDIVAPSSGYSVQHLPVLLLEGCKVENSIEGTKMYLSPPSLKRRLKRSILSASHVVRVRTP